MVPHSGSPGRGSFGHAKRPIRLCCGSVGDRHPSFLLTGPVLEIGPVSPGYASSRLPRPSRKPSSMATAATRATSAHIACGEDRNSPAISRAMSLATAAANSASVGGTYSTSTPSSSARSRALSALFSDSSPWRDHALAGGVDQPLADAGHPAADLHVAVVLHQGLAVILLDQHDVAHALAKARRAPALHAQGVALRRHLVRDDQLAGKHPGHRPDAHVHLARVLVLADLLQALARRAAPSPAPPGRAQSSTPPRGGHRKCIRLLVSCVSSPPCFANQRITCQEIGTSQTSVACIPVTLMQQLKQPIRTHRHFQDLQVIVGQRILQRLGKDRRHRDGPRLRPPPCCRWDSAATWSPRGRPRCAGPRWPSGSGSRPARR